MSDFKSDGEHYWLGGRELPRVTRIVGPAYDGPIADAATLERARDLGDRVHELLEWYDNGFTDTEPEFDTKPYLRGWQRFLDESGFEIQEIEGRVYHPTLLYGGTFDRLGRLRGVPTIVDIKTGQPNRMVALQLIGYARAKAALDPTYREFKRIAVYLRADGTYRTEQFTDDDGDWAAFKGLLAFYRWKERMQ